MSLENSISKINQLVSSRQINPQREARMKAIEADFSKLSDEELRAIASGETSEEFRSMSDHELWEIIARES